MAFETSQKLLSTSPPPPPPPPTGYIAQGETRIETQSRKKKKKKKRASRNCHISIIKIEMSLIVSPQARNQEPEPILNRGLARTFDLDVLDVSLPRGSRGPRLSCDLPPLASTCRDTRELVNRPNSCHRGGSPRGRNNCSEAGDDIFIRVSRLAHIRTPTHVC
jgi:hypothetical protein